MRRPTRRQFVKQAALVIGAAAAPSLLSCRPRRVADAAPDAALPLSESFTRDQFATLTAVCECLLPRDVDPGAIDLGVPAFIDRQMKSPELAHIRDQLRHLLPVLDQESKRRYDGRPFHRASLDEQAMLLDSWHRSHEMGRKFIETTLTLTLEGAFGDPKYGGNAGGRGFAMVGFTPDAPLSKMAPMDAAHSGSHL